MPQPQVEPTLLEMQTHSMPLGTDHPLAEDITALLVTSCRNLPLAAKRSAGRQRAGERLLHEGWDSEDGLFSGHAESQTASQQQ